MNNNPTQSEFEDEILDAITVPNSPVCGMALRGHFDKVAFTVNSHSNLQNAQHTLYSSMVLKGIALGLSKEF